MNGKDFFDAIMERNRAFDGRIVYGVRSTGVYCRPSCPSKKPQRSQVVFFSLPELAEQAGFRPCRRCRPDQPGKEDPKVHLARSVCGYIENHLGDDLTLPALSQHFALSPAHLQRTFTETVGISPRAYAEACRMKRVRGELKRGGKISTSLYDAGFASSSGLYAKSNGELGMSPGRYKNGGQGSHIVYAARPCRLGYLLVAATQRGICAVQLGDSETQLAEQLFRDFGQAEIERGDDALAERIDRILQQLEGTRPATGLGLDMEIQSTSFQRRVWRALQRIPWGSTRSYGQIAKAIGAPGAARAVGKACAANPIALLVPCHRAVLSRKGLGGYRWGVDRKRAILSQEKEPLPDSSSGAETP